MKYCDFFQEFSKVCNLSLASTRLLLVVQKITSQQEGLYTRIALRALKVSYSDVGEGGVAVNCEKTQFFMNTLYFLLLDKSFFCLIRINFDSHMYTVIFHMLTINLSLLCLPVLLSSMKGFEIRSLKLFSKPHL